MTDRHQSEFTIQQRWSFPFCVLDKYIVVVDVAGSTANYDRGIVNLLKCQSHFPLHLNNPMAFYCPPQKCYGGSSIGEGR